MLFCNKGVDDRVRSKTSHCIKSLALFLVRSHVNGMAFYLETDAESQTLTAETLCADGRRKQNVGTHFISRGNIVNNKNIFEAYKGCQLLMFRVGLLRDFIASSLRQIARYRVHYQQQCNMYASAKIKCIKIIASLLNERPPTNDSLLDVNFWHMCHSSEGSKDVESTPFTLTTALTPESYVVFNFQLDDFTKARHSIVYCPINSLIFSNGSVNSKLTDRIFSAWILHDDTSEDAFNCNFRVDPTLLLISNGVEMVAGRKPSVIAISATSPLHLTMQQRLVRAKISNK